MGRAGVRAIVAILLVVSGAGRAWANDPVVQRRVPAGAKLLVVDAMEPRLFHRHTGATGFSSFGRQLGGNSDALVRVRERLSSTIRGAGYDVAWEIVPESVAPPGKRYMFPRRGPFSMGLNKRNAEWVRQKMQQHDAAAVVVIFPEMYPTFVNPASYGLGLATSLGDPPRDTWVTAVVGAYVLLGSELEMLPHPLEPEGCSKAIAFPTLQAESIKALSGDHLKTYNDTIADLAERNVRQQLSVSGALGLMAAPCPGTPLPVH